MSRMGYFGLDEEGYDRIYSDRELVSRVIKLFKPYKRSMIIVIITLILSSFTYGLTPFFMTLIISQLEMESDPMLLIIVISSTFIINSLIIIIIDMTRRIAPIIKGNNFALSVL